MLDGVASGRDLNELHAELGALHDRRSSFPARPLLELAADAFTLTGSSHDRPLELAGLTEKLAADWSPHGSTGPSEAPLRADRGRAHRRRERSPRTSAGGTSTTCGTTPFVAAVTYVRAAAAAHGTDVTTNTPHSWRTATRSA